MSCAVALGPAMEIARSPDSRVSAKLITSTVRQTSRASTARRNRKRSMAQRKVTWQPIASSHAPGAVRIQGGKTGWSGGRQAAIPLMPFV